MNLFNYNQIELISLRKNEAMDQLLLKKFAKDNELLLWCLYIRSDYFKMNYQLISIIGSTNTIK
jgi:hypothetical protein